MNQPHLQAHLGTRLCVNIHAVIVHTDLPVKNLTLPKTVCLLEEWTQHISRNYVYIATEQKVVVSLKCI